MGWFNAFHQVSAEWAAGLGWAGEGLVRLVLAAALGGAIGLEREISGHEAGFRTYTLVCLGCAVAMLVSVSFAQVDWRATPAGPAITTDVARIAYGVMAGIGFIGAGTIIHARGQVRGLTTAAGIWCAAAIGLGAGLGQYALAIAAMVIVLLCLRGMSAIEYMLPRRRSAMITLRCSDPRAVPVIRQSFEEAGHHVRQVDYDQTSEPAGYAQFTLFVVTTRTELLDDVQRLLAGRSDTTLLRLQADSE